MIEKLADKSVNEDLVWMMVKQRGILEKTKPIEIKLKYQVSIINLKI